MWHSFCSYTASSSSSSSSRGVDELLIRILVQCNSTCREFIVSAGGLVKKIFMSRVYPLCKDSNVAVNMGPCFRLAGFQSLGRLCVSGSGS